MDLYIPDITADYSVMFVFLGIMVAVVVATVVSCFHCRMADPDSRLSKITSEIELSDGLITAGICIMLAWCACLVSSLQASAQEVDDVQQQVVTEYGGILTQSQAREISKHATSQWKYREAYDPYLQPISLGTSWSTDDDGTAHKTEYAYMLRATDDSNVTHLTLFASVGDGEWKTIEEG